MASAAVERQHRHAKERKRNSFLSLAKIHRQINPNYSEIGEILDESVALLRI